MNKIIMQHVSMQAIWMLIGMKLFNVWQSWLWSQDTADYLTFITTVTVTLGNLLFAAIRVEGGK